MKGRNRDRDWKVNYKKKQSGVVLSGGTSYGNKNRAAKKAGEMKERRDDVEDAWPERVPTWGRANRR